MKLRLYNNIHCPLCNKEAVKIILVRENYKIIECKECKIAFTQPPPKLPNYESLDFHNDSSTIKEKLTYKKDLHPTWIRAIDNQLDLILKNTTENSKILEIGCGEGYLLEELQQSRPYCIGIEPSVSAAERAKRKGLNIEQGFFNEQLIGKKKFDLILMSHVLEHIEDLNSTLSLLYNSLNENGLLFLIQTNFKGALPKIRKSNWYAWAPDQHYWHFTPLGLRKLLLIHGFQFKKIQYSSLIHSGKDEIFSDFLRLTLPRQLDQFHILFKK